MDAQERYKREAGRAAADLVSDGQVVGLGTGSTAVWAVRRLGERARDGLRIVGIPTSESTRREAEAAGIPLTDLSTHPRIDVTIDGADEIDPSMDLIKGLGGALVREKVVALVSDRMIVVADESKMVGHLGTTAPVPVEVVPFAVGALWPLFADLGALPVLRPATGRSERPTTALSSLPARGTQAWCDPFVSDNGNWIVDLFFDGLEPAEAEGTLEGLPGVVACGLFLKMAHEAVISGPSGVRHLKRT